MLWLGIFIGGFIGMIIMSLLQMGKISGLYGEIDGWSKASYSMYRFIIDNKLTTKYDKWAKEKSEKATSEKPK